MKSAVLTLLVRNQQMPAIAPPRTSHRSVPRRKALNTAYSPKIVRAEGTQQVYAARSYHLLR
jgi:hypothetical protein